MDKKAPRALWIVITRPDNLPNALAVAEALRDPFPGGAHLLLERSGWWERADWETLRPRFAGVHEFPRIADCRGLCDLPRLLRETLARQRALAALPAGPDDLAVCLAGLTKLANAVASAWTAAGRPKPLLCAPLKKYDDLRVAPDRRRFRWTMAGWLQNHVAEPLAGLHRTLHLKPRGAGQTRGDGVRVVRFQTDPDAVFGPIVLLSNAGRELPRAAGPRVRPAPFPNFVELSATLRPAPGVTRPWRVLFFGTPFLLVQNLPPAVYVEHLDRCLAYLRQHYAASRELVYRPHPAETAESTHLQLDGFRVGSDGEVAELLFLKHASEIAAVYSVSSTVSRAALNSGLNAYSFWRCFPFAPKSTAYFETLMGTVPPGFDVRDLARPPVAYAERQPGKAAAENQFAEALRAAAGNCEETRGAGWKGRES